MTKKENLNKNYNQLCDDTFFYSKKEDFHLEVSVVIKECSE